MPKLRESDVHLSEPRTRNYQEGICAGLLRKKHKSDSCIFVYCYMHFVFVNKLKNLETVSLIIDL